MLGAGLELLESRSLLAVVPLGAMTNDTAEYMLGDVNVTVVFLESSVASQNTETWTSTATNRVKSTIQASLDWWEDTLAAYHPDAYLDFHIDFTFADNPFVVPFEPINNTSDQHIQFVDAFLSAQGFTTGTRDDKVYAFNHAQRVAKQTNWSFTMFVVNDENDKLQDGTGDWAVGGTFQQAFAFPGGRYSVMLSDRPTSTFVHETGHIFWAFDEYDAGNSYHESRGYYNTQNLNGKNSAPPGFSQQNSIMSSGDPLTQSYLQHSLPAATRAVIGWKDTDNDGLLDVLDVPFSLAGNGFRDASGNYRFVGTSKVRALPNLNTVGLKNDISLNRIRVAEYSFDGVNWNSAGPFDTYSANLDLTIPLSGQTQISIRTRDTLTGATSEVFTAPTNRLSSTTKPGINGFVFNDLNHSGAWDPTEPSLAGRSVQLVTAAGQPLAGPVILEPNNYAPNTQLNDAIPQVSLEVVGTNASATIVYARNATFGSTSTIAFGGFDKNNVLNAFWTGGKQLRMNFQTPVRQISLDAIGALTAGSYARLDAYDANGMLLARYTTGQMALGAVETMTVSSAASDIAYAIAYGHANTNVGLDHLQIGAPVSTTTDTFGGYSLPYHLAGTYYVKVAAPADWESTNPASGVRQTTLAAGQTQTEINFGQKSTNFPWQNSENRFDVDGDHLVTPLDALLIIIDLNATGPRQLTDPPSGEGPPRLIDVNGDGAVTALDALEVIIRLNSGSGGEGESPGGGVGNGGTGAPGVPAAGESVARLTEAVFGPVSPQFSQAAEPFALVATLSEEAPRGDSAAVSTRTAMLVTPIISNDVPVRSGASRGTGIAALDFSLPLKRKSGRDVPAAPRSAAHNLAPFVPEIDAAALAHIAADVAQERARHEAARSAERDAPDPESPPSVPAEVTDPAAPPARAGAEPSSSAHE